MLPLSMEAVKGKQKIGIKNPRFFSLNKIKPGMRQNQWPNVSSKPSTISVKMKSMQVDMESRFGIKWRVDQNFQVCGLGNDFPLLVSLGQTSYKLQDIEMSWCFRVHKSATFPRTYQLRDLGVRYLPSDVSFLICEMGE